MVLLFFLEVKLLKLNIDNLFTSQANRLTGIEKLFDFLFGLVFVPAIFSISIATALLSLTLFLENNSITFHFFNFDPIAIVVPFIVALQCLVYLRNVVKHIMVKILLCLIFYICYYFFFKVYLYFYFQSIAINNYF